MWFQGELDPEKSVYTKKDACDIIERWGHVIVVNGFQSVVY